MSHGINIQNASGSVIVSEEFSNYFLSASGVFANGAAPAFAEDVNELLFLRPHEGGGTIKLQDFTGSVPTTQYASTSGYVEYARMRRNVTSGVSSGLRIFRADGSIAFDSGLKPLCPVMMVNNSPPPGSFLASTTAYAPFSTPVGKKRFIASNTIRRIAVDEVSEQQSTSITTTATFVNNTQFSFSSEGYKLSPLPYLNTTWAGTVLYLIVDI